MKIGLIAPKHSKDEMWWLLSFINVDGEPYQRGKIYDVVWFFNLTQEIKFIKRHTTTKIFAVAPEPKRIWPSNYDPELINLCDYYLGYDNFGSDKFTGIYRKFYFFAAPTNNIKHTFISSLDKKRDIDFCLFARHDPNIRNLIASKLAYERSILAGPLFGNPQSSKIDIQIRCKYEFITENEINHYYLSEKLTQSLMTGVVPIYYGCTNVKNIIPHDLFIDFHDFLDHSIENAIEKVIHYCKQEANYRKHFLALQSHALDYLQKYASIEPCMTDHCNKYLTELVADQFKARYKSLYSYLAFKTNAILRGGF